MKIEICDREYWKRLNWHDGLLYCSSLNIDGHNDWRLPKGKEYFYQSWEKNVKQHGEYVCWYFEDSDKVYFHDINMWIIPVREISYDRNK